MPTGKDGYTKHRSTGYYAGKVAGAWCFDTGSRWRDMANDIRLLLRE